MGALLFFGAAPKSAVREFGLLFLLIASPYAGACLSVLQRHHGVDSLELFTSVQVDAFAPYVFWLFAGLYPAANLSVKKERWLKHATNVALSVGILLFTSNLLMFVGEGVTSLSSDGWLGILNRFKYPSLYWPLVFGSLIPAILFLLSRIPGSDPTAKRRLGFLAFSVAVGVLPMLIITIAHNISVVARSVLLSPENEPLTFLFVDVFMLSLPLTCGYSLLAHRVFSLRYVLTIGAQYLLARYSVLLFAVFPIFLIFIFLLVNLNASVGDLLANHGLWILSLATISALTFWNESRLLDLIDRKFLNNTFDTQTVMVELVSGLSAADQIERFGAVVKKTIEPAISSNGVSALLLDSDSNLTSIDKSIEPLRSDSLLYDYLLSNHKPFETSVELNQHATKWTDSEKYWLIDNDVALLVPIGAIGLIAIKSKANSNFFTGQEIALVELISRAIETKARSFIGRLEAEVDAPGTRCCLSCGAIFEQQVLDCAECGSFEFRDLDIPKRIGGKYSLVERAGVGGSGVVFKAKDEVLERYVAIKTLPEMSLAKAIELKNEARMMAGFSHPNLAAVYGVETVRGRPLMIMELFEAGTLREAIDSDLALDSQEVISQLCTVVQWIHDKGLAHRDIKPDNIGLGKVGELKLMDFGLGKFLGNSRESIEELGVSVSGTIAYLPPESFLSGTSERVSDLWALGIVIHEVLTGVHPFVGTSQQDTIKKILLADYEPLASLPNSAKGAFVRAFSADPKARPSSARELRDLLSN